MSQTKVRLCHARRMPTGRSGGMLASRPAPASGASVKRGGTGRGLVSFCIGGGRDIALILERDM
ncbi:hypothetical protein [Ruegeria marina]|uniref:Uncharacterized protein n=1 Tax=Ruegeria marina TaxID=639004 RepID=A0A1G6IC14_9RHOB|nr:hypothetical protein [Ruegeria marina]SDC03286.1 hypothetical protein SAMN04488239_10166 [Ruegeria marina]